ncbi:MAG: hypothetical protein U0271_28660 [Polyangiaceae bacterium]
MRVRTPSGLGPAKSSTPLDLPELYDTEDLSSVLSPMGGPRFYFCRCSRWVEFSDRALEDPDADNFEAPNLPWSCAGHPPAALPQALDGVEVTGENLAALIDRSLHGWTPPRVLAEDASGAYWPLRMHTRLGDTPWHALVARTVAAAMDAPDPRARGRALQFFFSQSLAVGMERAVELLAGDRRLFAGVPDEITQVRADKTLEETLWRVVTPLVAAPGPARDLARTDALATGKGSEALYAALTSGDAAWVAEHALEIARATPARIEDLVTLVRIHFPTSLPSAPVVAELRKLVAPSS